MMFALHKNAATSPEIRRKIAQSDGPVAVLAMRCCVSEDTARKWKKRDSFEDRSYTAHRLQTTLTPAKEIVVVELRRMFLLARGLRSAISVHAIERHRKRVQFFST
jgi:hypothetical protein